MDSHTMSQGQSIFSLKITSLSLLPAQIQERKDDLGPGQLHWLVSVQPSEEMFMV